MSTSAPPAAARVVVIGGGIGGCSAAWHLAALGCRDVLLLERAGLSSGTTWHSTGNMETYRADPLVYEMVRYAVELYPRIAAEADRDIGWRRVGRVVFTDRPERWAAMRELPELGRARGIELTPLDRAGLAAHLPILDTAGLIGGLWIPSDARVNPTDAVLALSSAARARGVSVRTELRIGEIVVGGGRVRGVRAGDTLIECETVVIAAGLWSAELAHSAGAHLPMHALEHQYLITQPLGIDRKLPLFLSYDDQLYGREEVGGLMVGSLDDAAIPLSATQLPQTFSFALLNERWPQFEPYLQTAMRRFPILRDAPVKMLLNGPESFTPDGQMLLGPVPGVTGLWAACGFNSNGMALAPAAGRFIAEWIVEGAPSADVATLDVRRFAAALSQESFLRARVSEIPGYHCRIHALDDDYASGRSLRLPAMHADWAAAGARFASVNGWERALCCPAAAESVLAAVAREVAAASTQCLLVDHSTHARTWLHDAGDFAPQASSLPVAWSARQTLAALLDDRDQVEALVRVLPFADGVLLVAGPEQEMRVAEWLRRRAVGRHLTDLTHSHALLELFGPRRHELLAAAGCAPATAAVGNGSHELAGTPVRLWADADMDSTLLLMPTERSREACARLLGAAVPGAPERVVTLGGHLACEALRVARGVPAFGAEASPARIAVELGLRGARAGAHAAVTARTHRPRELVAFDSALAPEGFGAREPVLRRDATVGELTSRVRLPGWPAALALALLEPDAQAQPDMLECIAGGRRVSLSRRTTAWG